MGVPSAQGSFSFLENPTHAYTIAANITWAVLFGWALVLAHLAAAIVQAVTIIGIPTAILNVQLAAYVMCAWGRVEGACGEDGVRCSVAWRSASRTWAVLSRLSALSPQTPLTATHAMQLAVWAQPP